MPAYARFEDDQLIVGNDLCERRWRMISGRLRAGSLRDKATGREWCRDLAPAGIGPFSSATLTTCRLKTPVSREFLRAELSSGEVTLRCDVFDTISAITLQLVLAKADARQSTRSSGATGIETEPHAWSGAEVADLADCLALDSLHCDLIAVEMLEQTDVRENLVFEKRWMLQPGEGHAAASGNIFFIEQRATGHGLAVLKHAPAPYARPFRAEHDCKVKDGVLQLHGLGLDVAGGEGYAHSIICYTGGKTGRTAALQQLQQALRVYRPALDGALLSNTWGDRNRDAAISEQFLLHECDAGATLGVDVMQIDDGWQKGRSANSAEKGGVWNGFWASDENYWQANPNRLPNGLAPVVTKLRQHGMSLGLWYAPDSTDDCVNWQRDAQQILRLWREHGIRHIKVDAVKMHSRAAESRVRGFYEMILQESEGDICFDTDVTAEVRPGFWGMLDTGPIFVENRYTDWHRYWPHLTLRNLWLLSHYIPPVRLRMEFLNNQRNDDKYGNDPLRPSLYSPDTLFAMVMFASPLAWFEVSRLPAGYVEKVAPLVRLWKEHRATIQSGITIPIGSEPDGFSWSGFRSLGRPGYAVLFNELSDESSFLLPVAANCRLLHGDARVENTPGGAVIQITKALGHAFVQFQPR